MHGNRHRDRAEAAAVRDSGEHTAGIPRELLFALTIMAAAVILLFDNMRDALMRAGLM